MMIDNSQFSIFDWSDEILFSNTFNVYNNELKLEKIWWFDLIFNFTKDWNENEWQIKVQSDSEKKEIRILLTNFWTTLGTWTTNKMSIMTIGSWMDKKEIFFSLFGSSLNEINTFLQVTLTIYAR